MLSLLLTTALAGEVGFRHQIAGSYFPEGLRYAFRADYSIPLWNSDSILFQDTFFAPGLYLDVTPAYAHVGPIVRFSPIAVLEIEAQADAGYYFGSFSGVTDFYGVNDKFDSDARDVIHAMGGHKASGPVFRASVSPTLQAKVSHFIIALPQEFVWIWKPRPEGNPCSGDPALDFNAEGNRSCIGDYWYEPQYDSLLQWNDLVMTNSALAFWAFRESSDEDPRMFWLGVNFTHQYTFGTKDRTTKIGPMAVFKPAKSPYVPTFAVFSQAYLTSRIYEAFPPYIAIAGIWTHGLKKK